jgi:glycyl-tRNA synthetase beta chain
MSKTNSNTQSANLLIEVFTEELPPKSLRRLGDAFSEGIFNQLKSAKLTTDASVVTSFGTPRRLAVLISNVLAQAQDYKKREKLLPTSVAYDAEGKVTPPLLKKLAALGHADIDLSTLEKAGEGKNEALYLNIVAKGALLEQTAQTALEQTLSKLPIAKMMHYQVLQKNGELADVQFARPAHRIIALHGIQFSIFTALALRQVIKLKGTASWPRAISPSALLMIMKVNCITKPRLFLALVSVAPKLSLHF